MFNKSGVSVSLEEHLSISLFSLPISLCACVRALLPSRALNRAWATSGYLICDFGSL